MMLGRWSKDWPTEEGFYWYYGYPFNSSVRWGLKAELIIVKIYRQEGIDCLLCTSFEGSGPLYQKEDGAPFGVFFHRRISSPKCPSQDLFEKSFKEKMVLFHKKERKGKEFELRRAKKTVLELEQWLTKEEEKTC